MPALSSPLTTPAGMPIVNRSSVARSPGFKHLTRAEFDQAVIDERAAITGGSGLYQVGERLYIIGEEGYRAWLIGTGADASAIAASSHARNVVLSSATTRALAADANAMLPTSGLPGTGVGATGDQAIDRATGAIYTRGASVWAQSATDSAPSAAPGAAVTATGPLPATALGTITPVNASSATIQTLPPAAAAWAAKPYGLVVLLQQGVGVPSFAAGSGDTLRATAGISPCVQYGMCAAQVISPTEWALA